MEIMYWTPGFTVSNKPDIERRDNMKTNTKIAGTTFHPLPEGQFLRVKQTYNFDNVPCADADALLIPEPENQYDHEAVKVMVPLDNGQPFHIGYLPKDSELKRMIKRTYVASIMVKNYALNSPQYSPSWIITEVNGL